LEMIGNNRTDDDLSESGRRVFGWGTLISFTLMLIGLGYAVVTGSPVVTGGFSPSAIVRDFPSLNPAEVVGLGIIAMLLTPVANVLIMVPLFARVKDHLFVLVSLLVLAIMAFSAWLAVR